MLARVQGEEVSTYKGYIANFSAQTHEKEHEAKSEFPCARRTTARWPYKLQPYRLHMRGLTFMPE